MSRQEDQDKTIGADDSTARAGTAAKVDYEVGRGRPPKEAPLAEGPIGQPLGPSAEEAGQEGRFG